ncbi:class I SAM-dependent methyltransferase [Legionella septentrionalis]|uniref:Class I SAM-dependent methyltransferase n=1 Tax=Legionella septentrionalis TaxID=2498109 RepID=A0A433JGZ5_9GAMM|nr:class I SAM-dependent methyltransferase [Legionella septentrionalis]RUQ81552.1 class I SAM-dependent methyltransferase [Legionella septentrionalis]
MTAAAMSQEEIDEKNSSFWNELCGTQLAKELGVVDSSKESLAKFDRFYLDYYPYLAKYLFLDEIKGKNVLEVGLGYGTVSQLLALHGANYHGLDIAENAAAMARHRLKQHQLAGDVRVGSMLDCPFPDNYFDYVISIGCFHHTGDLRACIRQTHRILKKGGKASIMVYNKFSLRQWMNWPKLTSRNLLLQFMGKEYHSSTEQQRKAYDASAADEGAPATDFFSVKEIKRIFNDYDFLCVTRENFDEGVCFNIGRFTIYRFDPRLHCLESKWVRNLGLDLYIQASK